MGEDFCMKPFYNAGATPVSVLVTRIDDKYFAEEILKY